MRIQRPMRIEKRAARQRTENAKNEANEGRRVDDKNRKRADKEEPKKESERGRERENARQCLYLST